MSTTLLHRETTTTGVEIRPPTSASRALRSGAAVAAMIAGMIGMLTLSIVNFATEASEAFSTWVHGVGKLWMPGAEGIGPYSGKETLALVAWLASWAILHPALRDRDPSIARWLVIFLIGIGIATTLLWPPVIEHLLGN
ncbi:MAG TPA: hypothetical protein VFC42_04945 [Methylomirabilota bacterium]|jgi:hypothetical protein|nr:hypothetical protein [Methylomirabilota bacterium]